MMVTEKEEQGVSKDLPNLGRVMILDKEATDPLLMVEPKETLPVEVIVGDTLEEEIVEKHLETAIADQILETGTQINHHTDKEGLRATPETVVTARMGTGMVETGVKEKWKQGKKR